MAAEGCSLPPKKEKNPKTPAFRTRPLRLRPPVVATPLYPAVESAPLSSQPRSRLPVPTQATQHARAYEESQCLLNEFRLHL